MVAGVLFSIVAMVLRRPYVNALAADAATAQLAYEFLGWFIPAMGLQFVLVLLRREFARKLNVADAPA